MTLATLTTKGQVTIPKQVREALKLHAGDRIEITVTEKNEAIITPVSKKVDDVYGKLYKKGRKATSIGDIDKAINNRMKEKYL